MHKKFCQKLFELRLMTFLKMNIFACKTTIDSIAKFCSTYPDVYNLLIKRYLF